MAINYDELKKNIHEFIKTEISEGRLEGTSDDVYAEWHEDFKTKLRIMSDNAIMRFIATQKCGIKVHTSIEPVDGAEFRKEVKIKDMSLAMKKKGIEVTARVARVDTGKTKKEKDFTTITLDDGTGSVPIKFWNEEALKYASIQKGVIVHVRGYIDDPFMDGDQFDFKVGKFGHFEVVDDSEAPELPDIKEPTIAEIKTNRPKHVDLTCKIIKKDELKETKNGKKYASFAVSDAEGEQIFVKIFDEPLANKFFKTFNVGDAILLDNFSSNVWKNLVSLQNNWDKSSVKQVTPQVALPVVEYKGKGANAIEKDLVDVKDGDNVRFVGMFTRLYATKPYYDMCPNDKCYKGVTDGFCAKCGEVEGDPIPRPRLGGTITDGETNLKFSIMGDIVETLLGINANQIKEQFDAIGEAKAFIENFADRVQGKWYRCEGSVKLDKAYRGDLDIMLNKVDEIVEFNAQTKKITEEIKESLA